MLNKYISNSVAQVRWEKSSHLLTALLHLDLPNVLGHSSSYWGYSLN